MTNGVEAFSVFGGESRPIKLTLGFGFCFFNAAAFMVEHRIRGAFASRDVKKSAEKRGGLAS